MNKGLILLLVSAFVLLYVKYLETDVQVRRTANAALGIRINAVILGNKNVVLPLGFVIGALKIWEDA
uniref:Uncharacterized protein n=1 Tax=Strigamia maritima TaxID=126957 RepID=T1J175_STRMM